jgi:hypothetical protein
MLNRKPETLRTWDPDLYRDLWRSAVERARLETGDSERAGREYESANALYPLYEQTKKPAFSPDYPEPIIRDTDQYDRLRICTNRHIELALGDQKPLPIPTYLESCIYDEDKNWEDKVCDWLKANDDENYDYTYHRLSLSGENDLSGDTEIVYFVKDNNRDQYWHGCYVVWGANVYDLSDCNIGGCGILDVTIDWRVYTLSDDDLPSECRTDEYSQGYSRNPTGRLAKDLIGEPVYHWGHKCFVGRLTTYPHPVKLFPGVSSYGA